VLSRSDGAAREAPPLLDHPIDDGASRPRGGFALLLAIGVIDGATRTGFLTFLPFLLKAKGTSPPTVGLALTLVFAGGAVGKLVCGFLGARIGMSATVIATEGATALGIAMSLLLPLGAVLAVLPAIGIALNGTSSVLYGTVPELAPVDKRQRAFGLFYTGTIGAGALSPAMYGLVGDVLGVPVAMLMIAALVLITLPLAWRLSALLKGTDAIVAGRSN
jgi:MFS family permease